jgi:hypothetical protein
VEAVAVDAVAGQGAGAGVAGAAEEGGEPEDVRIVRGKGAFLEAGDRRGEEQRHVQDRAGQGDVDILHEQQQLGRPGRDVAEAQLRGTVRTAAATGADVRDRSAGHERGAGDREGARRGELRGTAHAVLLPGAAAAQKTAE